MSPGTLGAPSFGRKRDRRAQPKIPAEDIARRPNLRTGAPPKLILASALFPPALTAHYDPVDAARPLLDFARKRVSLWPELDGVEVLRKKRIRGEVVVHELISLRTVPERLLRPSGVAGIDAGEELVA